MVGLRRFHLVLALLALAPQALMAQEVAPASPEEAAKKRIGFYFGLRLTDLSVKDQANGISVLIDEPPVDGLPFPIDGTPVDVDYGSRLNLEFIVGFRLRDRGSIEATFMQWDEKQDLFQVAPEGKAFANVLASGAAGINEDIDGDGDVLGFEGGLASDPTFDAVLDGAEDLNFTGAAEFIPFDHANRIVGDSSTDYQAFDIDYRRGMKETKKFRLDWRAGLRMASLSQTHDIAYRELGAFAVFIDEEADIAASPPWNCLDWGYTRGTANPVQDGNGDGETNPNSNELDGDGFLNGNCNPIIDDRLESVETVSEDRIIGRIHTSGLGVKAGLDARFDFTKKWRITGSMGVALMHSDTKLRYTETFTSERDRFPNFIEWDFNGDGVYDMHDLDFDGSCAGLPVEECRIDGADTAAINGQLAIRYRDGIGNARVASPRGQNPGAFTGAAVGLLREGDPVPGSERNNDILRETLLLHDVSGKSKAYSPAIDLTVGFEWQFSRFASLGFGWRALRWMDAGRFSNLADDVRAGRTPKGDGDLDLSGGYFSLTIVPR